MSKVDLKDKLVDNKFVEGFVGGMSKAKSILRRKLQSEVAHAKEVNKKVIGLFGGKESKLKSGETNDGA